MALGSNQIKILSSLRTVHEQCAGHMNMGELADVCDSNGYNRGTVSTSFRSSVRRLVKSGLVCVGGPYPFYDYEITGDGLSALQAWEGEQQ